MPFLKKTWQHVTILLKVGLRLFVLFSLPLSAWSAPEDFPVRIAILQNVEQVTVKVRGRYTIIDPATQQEIKEGRRLAETKFRVAPTGLLMNGQALTQKRVRLMPTLDVSVFVNGKEKRYRGDVDIIKTADNKILVVNTLGIEEYIRGVLYHEISPRWPMDAIMAQAVAARSYAVYQVMNNKGRDFDVYSDIYSQVYGGRMSERYRTNLAVLRTRGEILTHKGEVLPAYFHATCAGHTEDVRELWKHGSIAPLAGVRCNYCNLSPHRHWKKNLRLADIQAKLNQSGVAIDDIKNILVQDMDESGRNKTLKIISRTGKEAVISGKDFRQLLGPNEIRSNKFRVEMKGYYCDILGEGWGHGVGLCQWGAFGMARQRYDYRAILAHYYPGSDLVTLMEWTSTSRPTVPVSRPL